MIVAHGLTFPVTSYVLAMAAELGGKLSDSLILQRPTATPTLFIV